jgi:hypothetical protein
MQETRLNDKHSKDTSTLRPSFGDNQMTNASGVEQAMVGFDYRAEAELFANRNRKSKRQPIGYRRFKRAADAIRFAIEELPPEFLVGAFSKSTKKDTTGAEFTGCTRARTIPWSALGSQNMGDEDRQAFRHEQAWPSHAN